MSQHQRIDAFELWYWRRLLRVPWTARRSNQFILKEISPEYSWKDWCWSWNSITLATPCEELTYLKRPWCWERLKAGGEGDDRGWDGWMASLIQWTWVWVNSGSWRWTGKPGILLLMGLQRVGHDWATELTELKRCDYQSWHGVIHPYAFYQGYTYFRDKLSTAQSLSCVWLFVTPWTAACQAPCPSTTPGACSNLGPLSRWCHPTIHPLSSPSPPAFNLS